MSAQPARPGAGHLLGAAGVVALCAAAYLVGTLNSSRAEIGAEVERSVRTGIQSGVDASLAPEKIQDRSAAAGRGLVDGLIDGAIDKATSRETQRLGRKGAGAMLREADAVAGVGLDVLEAVLEPQTEPPEGGAPGEGDGASSPAAKRPSLAQDVGDVAGEAVDLGFDVLDAFLAPPEDAAKGE